MSHICPNCSTVDMPVVDPNGWATCRNCAHLWNINADAPAAPITSAVEKPLSKDLPPLPLDLNDYRRKSSEEYMPGTARVGGSGENPVRALSTDLPIMPQSESQPEAQPPIARFDPPVAPVTRPEESDDLFFSNIEAGTDSGTEEGFGGVFPDVFTDAYIAPSEVSSVAPQEQDEEQSLRQKSEAICPLCGTTCHVSSYVEEVECIQCNTVFHAQTGVLVDNVDEDLFDELEEDADQGIIGRTIGGCVVDRKLGEGGMGSVYHARQLSLDREVAVKILPAELLGQTNFLHRFKQEAKSLARINHPNILQVYDFGEDPATGVFYMTMEFVDGEDLAELLYRKKRVNDVDTMQILEQSAMGLYAAAEKGVIHRDIKPDNLMIQEGPICKVTDFGLAKDTASITRTNAKIRVGTPAFMSPEQCDGLKLDARSDMYSLGCTCYVALTGRLPYDAESPFAIMLKHKSDPVPFVSEKVPSVHPRVNSFIYRLMEKKPDSRFANWDAVLLEAASIIEELTGRPKERQRPGSSIMPALAITPEDAPLPPASFQASAPVAAPATSGAQTAQNGPQQLAPGMAPEAVVAPRTRSDSERAALQHQALQEEKSSQIARRISEIKDHEHSTAVAATDVDMLSDRSGSTSIQAVPSSGTHASRGIREEPSSADVRAGSSRLAKVAKRKRQKMSSSRLQESPVQKVSNDVRVRGKIQESNKRQSEVISAVNVGNQFYDTGKYKKAIQSWKKVVVDIENLHERERVLARIQEAQGQVRRSYRRRVFAGTLVLVPVLAAALWKCVPLAHNWYADQEYYRIIEIDQQAERIGELAAFEVRWGNPFPWYQQIFAFSYRVEAGEAARNLRDVYVYKQELFRSTAEGHRLVQEGAHLQKSTNASLYDVREKLLQLQEQSSRLPVSERKDIVDILTKVSAQIDRMEEARQKVLDVYEQGQIQAAIDETRQFIQTYPRCGVAVHGLPRPIELVIVDDNGARVTDAVLIINGVVVQDQPVAACCLIGELTILEVTKPGFISVTHEIAVHKDMDDGYRAFIDIDREGYPTPPAEIQVVLQPGKRWEHIAAASSQEAGWRIFDTHHMSTGAVQDIMLRYNAERCEIRNMDSGAVLLSQSREALISKETGGAGGSYLWNKWYAWTTDGVLLAAVDGSVWEWVRETDQCERIYQGSLPVHSAKRYPYTYKNDVAGMVVVLAQVNNDIVQFLADGQVIEQHTIPTTILVPSIFVRNGRVCVVTDVGILIYEENGEYRSLRSFKEPRLGAVHWVTPDVLLVPTADGIEQVHFWEDGSFTIATALTLPELYRQQPVYDGIYMTALLRDGSLQFWKHAEGIVDGVDAYVVKSLWSQLLDETWELAYPPQICGDFIVLSEPAGRVWMYDKKTGEVIRRMQHTAGISEPAVVYTSANGEQSVIVYGTDNMLSAWHISAD